MHKTPRPRIWILIAGVAAPIASHALVLRYFSIHSGLPVAVISGTAVVLVLKHLGPFKSLRALFRRAKSDLGS